MKGFIEEYGKIIVVIILTLLMLGFGQTGLAKPLQNSLLKSTGMITNAHNKFDEVTKEPEPVTPGAIVDIEGTKYVVLEARENNQALVMTASSIGNKAFQSNYGKYPSFLRPDGQRANTYEGSEIDNYLENEWYNNLSSTMKSAIQATNIKQASYKKYNDPDSKQETGYNDQVYNAINRRAFLPSVSEIGKVVDLKNKNKVAAFLHTLHCPTALTRDSYLGYASDVEILHAGNRSLSNSSVANHGDVYPTFVIDLSQVNYKVTGHTDYK